MLAKEEHKYRKHLEELVIMEDEKELEDEAGVTIVYDDDNYCLMRKRDWVFLISFDPPSIKMVTTQSGMEAVLYKLALS